MRRWLRGIAVLSLVAAAVPTGTAAGAGASGDPAGGRQAGGQPTAMVGAASRSVLPFVDGSTDYVEHAALPPPDDATSLGVFVPAFDAGRVAVGNGRSSAHWVRDDLRARAIAVSDLRGRGDIVVVAAVDLYMVFRNDADAIRQAVAERLPRRLADRTTVLVPATHNHHGPDTAFDVNHEWYAQMVDQVADAAVEAVRTMRPARIRVGAGEHWFGMNDGRDPQVIDPSMNVLQARATNGDVIATMVQWNNHPEVTLGWEPPVDISAECEALGWTGDQASQCRAEGRYFTADYAGVLSRAIEERDGGVALYMVGALGALTTPLGASVWEVDDAHSLGNHYDPPPGAQPPGGEPFSYTDRNFRRMWVIGTQAAEAALRFIEDGEDLTSTPVSVQRETFYTRMSNIGFRLLLVVDEATGRSQLGHEPGMLHTCPATGPKDDTTCEPDGLATVADPVVGTIRAGDHVESEVAYVRIGLVGMMFLPGEVAGELVIGLPADWLDRPGDWFAGDPALHAVGADYETPGYVLNRMPDRYRWTIGLGSDELGYIMPISDWRIACVGDVFAGPGTCQALHDAGVIDFPDAVSGEQCKLVTEDPSALAAIAQAAGAGAAEVVGGSCRYGQVLGEPDDHYEETNAVGWDVGADMLAAVAALTGDDDPATVNPEFPGYWSQMPPPPS